MKVAHLNSTFSLHIGEQRYADCRERCWGCRPRMRESYDLPGVLPSLPGVARQSLVSAHARLRSFGRGAAAGYCGRHSNLVVAGACPARALRVRVGGPFSLCPQSPGELRASALVDDWLLANDGRNGDGKSLVVSRGPTVATVGRVAGWNAVLFQEHTHATDRK